MDYIKLALFLCLVQLCAGATRFGSSNTGSSSGSGRDSPSFGSDRNSFSSGNFGSSSDMGDDDDENPGPKINAWPGGIIPYEVDNSISSQDFSTLKSMLNDISSRTCVQFVPHRNEANYTLFTSGTTCSAPLGVSNHPSQGGLPPMKTVSAGGSASKFGSSSFGSSSGNFGGFGSGVSGASVVKLGKSCFQTKRLARRIMNLLGIPHETSRPDRDQFVTINMNNIRSGYLNNIKQIPASAYIPGVLDVPYDLQSVTQYSDSDLAKDKNTWAIKPKNSRSGSDLGGSNFSKLDIQKIQKAYRCRASG